LQQQPLEQKLPLYQPSQYQQQQQQQQQQHQQQAVKSNALSSGGAPFRLGGTGTAVRGSAASAAFSSAKTPAGGMGSPPEVSPGLAPGASSTSASLGASHLRTSPAAAQTTQAPNSAGNTPLPMGYSAAYAGMRANPGTASAAAGAGVAGAGVGGAGVAGSGFMGGVAGSGGGVLAQPSVPVMGVNAPPYNAHLSPAQQMRQEQRWRRRQKKQRSLEG
ncbi:hypothetical protein CLOP_g10255, partial [Closterium sp. NIES-67]